ncbi:unnamed protein product [Amoebophrya sp. A120]|nr:unnamed protein product [Amoebophrya sp. A120]|eukprot:GSA120T00018847001.1
MRRGPRARCAHGAQIDASYWSFGPRGKSDREPGWGQSGGINAGTMLFTPSEDLFRKIAGNIKDENYPGHIEGNAVEQDYISRFFGDWWHHLDCAYNYQLHQMYNAMQPKTFSKPDAKTAKYFQDLKIIHFSGAAEIKPWDLVLRGDAERIEEESEKLEEILVGFEGYLLWEKLDPGRFAREFERNARFRYTLEFEEAGGVSSSSSPTENIAPAAPRPIGFNWHDPKGTDVQFCPLLPDWALKKCKHIVLESYNAWIDTCQKLFDAHPPLQRYYVGAKRPQREVIIGGLTFPHISGLQRHIRAIQKKAEERWLSRAALAVTDSALDDEDQTFFLDLLSFHPEADQKLTNATRIVYGAHPDASANSFKVQISGLPVAETFSTKKCIEGVETHFSIRWSGPVVVRLGLEPYRCREEIAAEESLTPGSTSGGSESQIAGTAIPRITVDKNPVAKSILVQRSKALGAQFEFCPGRSDVNWAFSSRQAFSAVVLQVVNEPRVRGGKWFFQRWFRNLPLCRSRRPTRSETWHTFEERNIAKATAFFGSLRSSLGIKDEDVLTTTSTAPVHRSAIVAITTQGLAEDARTGMRKIWPTWNLDDSLSEVDDRCNVVIVGAVPLGQEDRIEVKLSGSMAVYQGALKKVES